ncbi:shikimate 5-dehydrogenase [Proteiniborus sp. DW1]|uniref:shikimate dehydrogenase n=1 Tax=Proteiniborus sp. DW1 TaxID=1889883 RepID=UPI00092E1B5D|nr:shikimate dehydrogenase [Proteiniborus sp. DW1]SCG83286.1 shikimate 5-dehydrogenase [Proteiniborus sp. DW1]
MKIDSDTKLYCLIGNPISKSLSPLIHNSIFEYNSINAKYLAFNIDNSAALEKVVHGLRALKVKGFNVTMPYKIEIMRYLDEIDEKAKILGAINTVLNIDGKLIGFNTDGDGFIKSLKDKEIDIKGKKALLVGAGGAAHSIAVSLAYEGIKEIIIVNRNIQNAHKLQKLIKSIYPNVHVRCYKLEQEEDIPKDIELLVNTTPIGMYPNIEDIPISPSRFNSRTLFYDIIYKPLNTKFILEAGELGYETINGIDMLINQAIYSQEIWNKELFDEKTDWLYIKDKIISQIEK